MCFNKSSKLYVPLIFVSKVPSESYFAKLTSTWQLNENKCQFYLLSISYGVYDFRSNL